MSERAGVEIDYCPECRGIWLDRGELDKILDRATSDLNPAPSRDVAPARQDDRRPAYDDSSSSSSSSGRHPRRTKKEHWLMEIFD